MVREIARRDESGPLPTDPERARTALRAILDGLSREQRELIDLLVDLRISERQDNREEDLSAIAEADNEVRDSSKEGKAVEEDEVDENNQEPEALQDGASVHHAGDGNDLSDGEEDLGEEQIEARGEHDEEGDLAAAPELEELAVEVPNEEGAADAGEVPNEEVERGEGGGHAQPFAFVPGRIYHSTQVRGHDNQIAGIGAGYIGNNRYRAAGSRREYDMTCPPPGPCFNCGEMHWRVHCPRAAGNRTIGLHG